MSKTRRHGVALEPVTVSSVYVHTVVLPRSDLDQTRDCHLLKRFQVSPKCIEVSLEVNLHVLRGRCNLEYIHIPWLVLRQDPLNVR